MAGLATSAACTDPPFKNVAVPSAVMRGTVTYLGPPPCTENGHIVGTANLLLFDTRLLPPPDGLGTRSARIVAISGDKLFRDVASTLYYDPSGKRFCPPPGSMANIQASASWELGPIDPATYQMRGFYDYNGDFHAAFRFSNLPTRGDIAGGSVANLSDALQGKAPIYTEIKVGIPTAVDSALLNNPDEVAASTELQDLAARCEKEPCTGCETERLCIPSNGLLLENVWVGLGLQIPFERPAFHIAEVQPPLESPTAQPPPVQQNPNRIAVPVDFQLANANPGAPDAVQASLYGVKLRAGLPDNEKQNGANAPFYMHIEQATFFTASFDLNRDGKLDTADHVIGTELGGNIWPLVTFTKIDASDPIKRTGQDKPRVLSSAITTLDGRLRNLLFQPFGSFSHFAQPIPKQEVTALIRPTGICFADAQDPNGTTLIVTPHATDQLGNPTVGNIPLTVADVATQLRRNPSKTKLINMCLPRGELATNVIYATTGQAWTIPNESGICMPGETPNGDTSCKCTVGCLKPDTARPRLITQSAILEFAAPKDNSTCIKRVDEKPEDAELFRTTCLTAAEQEKYPDIDALKNGYWINN
jgi:hypothetical protein